MRKRPILAAQLQAGPPPDVHHLSHAQLATPSSPHIAFLVGLLTLDLELLPLLRIQLQTRRKQEAGESLLSRSFELRVSRGLLNRLGCRRRRKSTTTTARERPPSGPLARGRDRGSHRGPFRRNRMVAVFQAGEKYGELGCGGERVDCGWRKHRGVVWWEHRVDGRRGVFDVPGSFDWGFGDRNRIRGKFWVRLRSLSLEARTRAS